MSILFTEAVMRAASEILERHHRAVAAAIYGKDALSPEDWDLAVNIGLVDPKAPPTTLNGQIYQMGMMLAHMDQAERQSRYGTTAEEWLTEVERNPVPMTVTEASAAAYARRRAAQFVKGLGTRATSSVTTTLLTEDARLSSEFRSAIRDAVGARFGDDDAAARLKDRGIKEGLADDFFDDAFRGTMGRLRSDIGHATGQWKRDLERIARTESVEMWNHGQVDEWDRMERDQAEEEAAPPRRTLVYRVPTPAACSSCRDLYTSGGSPRIFEMSELQGNGTNYKVKRADWKPIVGATHPYCVCDLQRLPAYVKMPNEWRSGESAPIVVGSDGLLVLPSTGDTDAS